MELRRGEDDNSEKKAGVKRWDGKESGGDWRGGAP